jgi:ubiquinone/menaquinone biosynthesis C-methylase UbiE
MSSKDRIQLISSIYDARAPTYDTETNFHAQQAVDYLSWSKPQPGQIILDLACGTGALTLPYKKAVGAEGKVIGVDISSVSLDIAKKKAEKEGQDITFLLHDIGNLDGLEAQGIEKGKFDVISVASAVVLLEDPAAAVKNWAKLLKPGGMLIFDILTNDSHIKGLVLELVAYQLGITGVIVYNRIHPDMAAWVANLLTDAGLDASESFLSPSYQQDGEWDGEKGGEVFDEMMGKKGWAEEYYKQMMEPEKKDEARKLFEKLWKERAGEDGKIRGKMQLYMAVGKKLA